MSMRLPSGRNAQRLALAITCCAILLSLSMRGRMMLHTEGKLHPWYHLALFIILGVLAMRSSSKWTIRFTLLAAAALLGLSIEYMEAFRYSIPLEWYDVRTDTSGVGLGGLLDWVLSLPVKKLVILSVAAPVEENCPERSRGTPCFTSYSR